MLPPAEHFQYFSHLFHSQTFIEYKDYNPDLNWQYPELDYKRFSNLFLQDLSYIKDKNILDLGCHTGYFSYIAKYLGAQSIHGVNARQFPIDVANFAFKQLGVKDYQFDVQNIENLNYLDDVCKNKDTVLMTLILEHLRNPYAILDIITKNNVQNLIIESRITDESVLPTLTYYEQSTESAFTVYDETERNTAIGSVPNLAWIETILYWLGWRIEYHTIERQFNKNWFATPGLKNFPPRTYLILTVLCKKFEHQNSNNYENV